MIIVLSLIVILAVVAFGAYSYYQNKSAQIAQEDLTYDCTKKPCESLGDEASNRKTYSNSEYGFQFQYPSNWTVQDISYTYRGAKSAVVNIISPINHSIAGYETIGASYTVQLQFYGGMAHVTLNSFVKTHETGEQDVKEIPTTATLKNTEEYKAAQQIIASAKALTSSDADALCSSDFLRDSTGKFQCYSDLGMQKYTDLDFGFSFWYPKSWPVAADPNALTPIRDGRTFRTLRVGDIIIREVYSATMSIIDTGGAGPFGPVKYFFNPSTHAWMTTAPKGTPTGGSGATTTITSFINTMGGLHMLGGTSRFDTNIIPLSAENFVVVSDNGGANADYLAKTIVALDPKVATPISLVEQIQTIQAEANAYSTTAKQQ